MALKQAIKINRIILNNIFRQPTSSRNYSKPGDDECKLTTKTGKKCPKFDICNCDQAEDTDCNAVTYVFKECTKREAPYPSFSEACYDDPYQKPSECKICPYKPEDHPTFKPQKKYMHTTSTHFSSKKSKGGKDTEVKVIKINLSKSLSKSSHKNSSITLPGISQILENEPLMMKGVRRNKCDENDDDEPCTKFPFKPLEEYSYERKPVKKEKKGDPCAKKQKKPIIDCPPTVEGPKCEASAIFDPLAMVLSDHPTRNDEQTVCSRKSQQHPTELMGDLKMEKATTEILLLKNFEKLTKTDSSKIN